MPVRDLLLSATSAAPATYVEDVFSTYLYQADGSSQITVNNGIDLASKGGLVWIKSRSNTTNNAIFDTVRGFPKEINSNTNDVQYTATDEIGSATSTGFTVPYNTIYGDTNFQTRTFASWTFRKQPKFFDIVTYTGNGTAGRTVAHNLGSTPGMIIVKNITTTGKNWAVYNQSLGATNYLALNVTDRSLSDVRFWNNTAPTSTQFTLGTSTNTNNSGDTYVAYLFANNAGGFGTSGTDNVISCGGGVSDGSALASVNLGYEPEFVLFKDATNASNWTIADNIRGMTVNFVNQPTLYPNLYNAEEAGFQMQINSTGFNTYTATSSANYIYMAIRRPMKVPTDATTVFNPVARTGTSATAFVSTGFVTDFIMGGAQGNYGYSGVWDRLKGKLYFFQTPSMYTTSYSERAFASALTGLDSNTGYTVGTDSSSCINDSAQGPYINWAISRRPTFFDVVYYTGTGSNTTILHNMTIPPEMIWIKDRTNLNNWFIYHSALGNTKYSIFNTTTPTTSSTAWNNTTPTSSVFSVGTAAEVNTASDQYGAYLFATCPNVSKVGSYTGNGASQTIACGFTGGARFVMIKRTDATGGWYVYDTARGMTTLTDPYLQLNSNSGATATLGSVTTTTGGFTVDASILSAINTSGASYIFLAIA